MLQTRITDEELEFMETLYNPIAAAECLFSGIELERSDNLACFDESFAEIRLGQLALMSYEYLLDDDPSLTRKQNFKLREGAGTVYVLGGRKYGKTLVTEKIDMLLCALLSDSERVGLTSMDASHIRGVIEDVIRALEQHPILSYLEPHVQRAPAYRISLKNGWTLDGINMNLAGKRPGEGFFQKHLTRLYIEEASFETEEVYKKRIDAVSEDGCVVRAAGMTNFRKHSPCGRIFYDLRNRMKVVNLPQYVSPKWDYREKEKSVQEHGGEQSITYRIFVRGEIVEDAISVIDMERVRKFYMEDREVKKFEITKDNFLEFEHLLIVERPRGTVNTYITADIGESAPTEIVILFELSTQDGSHYRYVYSVTCYNLTDQQQYRIFRHLAERTQANFIGIDTTDGTGRAIYRRLEEVFPKDNLCWVAFNEKLAVDYEKDQHGRVVIDNKGEPVKREEYVSEWSVKHLRDLLYAGRVEILLDYKLDIQLNSLIAMQSGMRTTYQCVSEEDHLLQAFQVFAITQWNNEFRNTRPILQKKFSKVGAFIKSTPEVTNGSN